MKVLVDSTVWIDFLRNRNTPHTDKLVELIQARADLCLCGFIMTEVLQGIREEKVLHGILWVRAGGKLGSRSSLPQKKRIRVR
ncbi:MAG: PIN domain-containing protein [Opitutus sp.]|nr:PIN domain-containing protein [Opitutus sp.]MCS6277037.1 PIN domain-containing protein [Opitutus sp.]MCS6299916.1 PIN domain-containing protein [Opitutus sp.]